MAEENEPKQEEAEARILLVYIGARINGEALDDYWLKVTKAEFRDGMLPLAEGNTRVYEGKESKKYMRGGVGSVYEVPEKVKDDGRSSVTPSMAKYQGMWPDDEKRFAWQAEDRMWTTTFNLRKKAKKDAADDFFEPLRPIREKYARLISQDQQAALLANVIAFITRG